MSAPPAMPGVQRDPTRVAAHHLDDHRRGRATRPWCAAGRSRRSRSAPRCRSRRSPRSRTGRCRSSSAPRPRGRPPPASLAATPSVSSPPITISASTRSRRNVSSTRATPSSVLNGFVRLDPRMVPPRGRIPRVVGVVSSHGLAVDHAPPAVAEPDDGCGRRRPRPCARWRGSPRSAPGSRPHRSALRCACVSAPSPSVVSILPQRAVAPDSLPTVNARAKVEEAARWRLEIGEPLLGERLRLDRVPPPAGLAARARPPAAPRRASPTGAC